MIYHCSAQWNRKDGGLGDNKGIKEGENRQKRDEYNIQKTFIKLFTKRQNESAFKILL